MAWDGNPITENGPTQFPRTMVQIVSDGFLVLRLLFQSISDELDLGAQRRARPTTSVAWVAPCQSQANSLGLGPPTNCLAEEAPVIPNELAGSQVRFGVRGIRGILKKPF